MQYRLLGRSGLKVSVIGLGTNAFGGRADRATAARIVDRALDHGVNLIDTANVYQNTQSETILGEAMGPRRNQVVLATKAGWVRGAGPNERGSSRAHLIREVEGSLRRLKTDYIDLFQIHTFDPETPLEETLRALDDLVSAGKIRYIGASNYDAWELAKAIGISERLGLVRYVSIQPSYSLADRTPERELIPLCRSEGVGLIAYFPLAGGILTGKYRPGEPPPAGSRAAVDPRFQARLDSERLRLAQTVGQLSEDIGASPSQLALAWLLQQPTVASAIAGASRPEQVDENIGALDVPLSDAARRALQEASSPFIYHRPFAEYRLDR